jgi:biotin carboxylase
MSAVAGCTVAVVCPGYEGKRPAYERMAELGVRLVLLDEPGHWSESLVETGLAVKWIPIAVTGDPDTDAATVLDALARAGVQPDGVLTIWEDSTGVVARVALALGLPGNPPAGVDAARSKVRTRELSAELGLPCPRARRVRSLDELYAAAGYVGFPAVVKPEFGASAVVTVRVDDLESVLAEVSVVAKDLRAARKLAAEVLRDPPVVRRAGY